MIEPRDLAAFLPLNADSALCSGRPFLAAVLHVVHKTCRSCARYGPINKAIDGFLSLSPFLFSACHSAKDLPLDAVRDYRNLRLGVGEYLFAVVNTIGATYKNLILTNYSGPIRGVNVSIVGQGPGCRSKSV